MFGYSFVGNMTMRSLIGKPKGNTPDSQSTLQGKIGRIGNHLALLGLPSLLIIFGVVFLAFYHTDKSREWVSHTHEVRAALSNVLLTLQEAEAGQRGFLLTGEEPYLEPYHDALGRLSGAINNVQKLTLDNPKQQKLLIQAMPVIDDKLKELRETISLMKSQNQEAAISMVNTDIGETKMYKIRSILNNMKREEGYLLAERNQTLQRSKVFSLSVGLIGFAFLVLISVLATLRVRAFLDSQAETDKELRYLASHDSLTGLATRRLGLEYMSFALSEARRYNHHVPVLFIDLDGFKPINDRYGHDVGDCLLQGVAQRLTSCVREIDMVSRVGGDEFIIVMSKIDSRENIAQIGQKLIDVLARPFPIGDEDISVGTSIGIALYPDHGQEPEKLFKCADQAMYGIKGKGKGRNRFAFAANSIEAVKESFPLTA